MIPYEKIEAIADHIDQQSDDDIDRMLDKMVSAQPLLSSYLIEAGEESLDEDGQQIMIFLALIIWQTLISERIKIASTYKISEKVLGQIEIENFRHFNRLLNQNPDNLEQALEQMSEGTNQQDLLNFILDFILDEDLITPPTQRAKNAYLFIYLKTFVDCLTR